MCTILSPPPRCIIYYDLLSLILLKMCCLHRGFFFFFLRMLIRKRTTTRETKVCRKNIKVFLNFLIFHDFFLFRMFCRVLLLICLITVQVVSSSSPYRQCHTTLFDASQTFLQSVNVYREAMLLRASSAGMSLQSVIDGEVTPKLQEAYDLVSDEVEYGVDRYQLPSKLYDYDDAADMETSSQHRECHEKLLKIQQVIGATLGFDVAEGEGENDNEDDARRKRVRKPKFSVVSLSNQEYGPSEPSGFTTAALNQLLPENEEHGSSLLYPTDDWLGDDEDVIDEALRFYFS